MVTAAQRRSLGTHRTGRPAPSRKADYKTNQRQRTTVLNSRADKHENHELRNHDEDVGEHVQHFVDPSSAETAKEADKHTDGGSDDARHQAHIEGAAEAFDQERHVVTAQVVGTQQVIAAGARIGASHDVTSVDVHMVEHGAKQRNQQGNNEDRDTDDKHRGLEKVS